MGHGGRQKKRRRRDRKDEVNEAEDEVKKLSEHGGCKIGEISHFGTGEGPQWYGAAFQGHSVQEKTASGTNGHF